MSIILVQNPRVRTSNNGIKNSLLPGGNLEPDQARVRKDGGDLLLGKVGEEEIRETEKNSRTCANTIITDL